MLESNPKLQELIRWELYRLHIPPNLRGHHYLVYAVERVVEAPLRVKDVTKDLYPDIAHQFGTTWKAVERSIRSAVLVCWNSGGREALREMTPLTERPKTAAFIAIVAAHVSSWRAAGPPEGGVQGGPDQSMEREAVQ